MSYFFLRIVFGLGGKREKQNSHTLRPCVSVYLFLSLTRTLIEFWVQFKLILTITLITSAKILFSNKVTF